MGCLTASHQVFSPAAVKKSWRQKFIWYKGVKMTQIPLVIVAQSIDKIAEKRRLFCY